MISAIIGNLFRGSKFQDADDESIVMEIDAVVNKTPKYIAKMTKNPVEKGSDITDHVELDPIMLSINGKISKTPVGIGRQIPDVTGGTAKARKVPTLGNLALFFGDRIQQSHDYLEYLHTQRNPFNFVTELKLYENMIMTELSFPSTPDTGDTLDFVCKMEQIEIVDSETIALTGIDSIEDQSSENVDDGKKQAKALSTAQENKASLLLSLFRAFTGS